MDTDTTNRKNQREADNLEYLAAYYKLLATDDEPTGESESDYSDDSADLIVRGSAFNAEDEKIRHDVSQKN